MNRTWPTCSRAEVDRRHAFRRADEKPDRLCWAQPDWLGGSTDCQRPRRFSTRLREFPTFFTAFFTADADLPILVLPAGHPRPILLPSARRLHLLRYRHG